MKDIETAGHRLISTEELLQLSHSERILYFLLRAYMAADVAAVIAEALQAIGWAFYMVAKDDEELRARWERKEEARDEVRPQ